MCELVATGIAEVQKGEKMDDLISRQAAIDAFTDEIQITGRANAESVKAYVKLVIDRIKRLPSEQPEIIHCRDCKHQIKNFYEDKRRKDGGYYIYGCELSDDYSHVCLDDDFCSRAERREE